VLGLGPRVGLPLNFQQSAQPGTIDLSWNSATGEYFSVEYTTNLANGFSGMLQGNILATPPVNRISVPLTNGSCFFRLRF